MRKIKWFILLLLLAEVSMIAAAPDVLGELKVLSKRSRTTPEESYYLKELLHESLRRDSIELAYETVGELARYYYHKRDRDSLIGVSEYIDSLATARKDNPDEYYLTYGYLYRLDIYQDIRRLDMNGVLSLYSKAMNTGQKYGAICSSETLGEFYLVCRLDSAAIPFFQMALRELEAMDGPPFYRLRLLACEIESSLRLNRFEDAHVLLEKMRKALDLSDEYDKKHHLDRGISYYRWQMHTFYVDLYLRQDRPEQAKEALDQASTYENMVVLHEYINYQIIYYFSIKAAYYNKVKDYPKALATVDTILKYNKWPEDVKLKIDILTSLGRKKEVAALYKDLIQMANKRNDESLLYQMNQLLILHDMSEKAIQKKELEISNKIMERNEYQLLASLIASFVLLIILYILHRSISRSRKLKNELMLERNALIDSRKKLSRETHKALIASQMKSSFIANISHEIRTPLNAIVGFSSMLSEPDYEEDRKSFVSLISMNSDLLLNLINDVLDFSHMESDNLRFVIKPCELVECCRNILSSIEHRVPAKVKLTLTAPVDSFLLPTDELRLKQLLLNLLGNATKFTSEGEINLSFRVDERERQVVFAVTDTGCGIPLKKQAKIFERYERLDEMVQGSGLGLSICCMIAERLGGSVTIDPTYTTGARFYFVHPY